MEVTMVRDDSNMPGLPHIGYTPPRSPAPAPAGPPAVSQVTVYQHNDYLGASQALPEGKYAAQQLTVGDNAISSVAIPAGFYAVLYDEDNFTGKSLVVSQSINALSNFNDLTSSIIITRDLASIGAGCIVYGGNNYQGIAYLLNAGDHNLAEIPGISNVGSVKVLPGYKLKLIKEITADSADASGTVTAISVMQR